MVTPNQKQNLAATKLASSIIIIIILQSYNDMAIYAPFIHLQLTILAFSKI